MALQKKTEQDNERKTIRMRKTLIREIEKMADDDNRNFNNMVETLLMTGANQYKKRFEIG